MSTPYGGSLQCADCGRSQDVSGETASTYAQDFGRSYVTDGWVPVPNSPRLFLCRGCANARVNVGRIADQLMQYAQKIRAEGSDEHQRFVPVIESIAAAWRRDSDGESTSGEDLLRIRALADTAIAQIDNEDTAQVVPWIVGQIVPPMSFSE